MPNENGALARRHPIATRDVVRVVNTSNGRIRKLSTRNREVTLSSEDSIPSDVAGKIVYFSYVRVGCPRNASVELEVVLC